MARQKSSDFLEIQGRQVEVTNLDKVLFPEDGYTKQDVIDYYIRVSPYLLPIITDRPMSMRPFPEGISGKRFWQKDIPAYAPDWLRTFRYEALEASKVLRWGLINDLPSLVWVANHASLELHPWSSRYDKPEYPDWAIFDLDPSEPAGFDHCREIARLLKLALDRLELRSYIKTTGQRGLQIYVPIVREHTYAQVREWVRTIAEVVGQVRPDLVTFEWDTRRRSGKVRIDYTQMVIGKTLVAAYAIRPLNGAPVSTPIEWDELDDPELRADRWNIKTILQRLKEKGDLFAGALQFDQHLPDLGGKKVVGAGLKPALVPTGVISNVGAGLKPALASANVISKPTVPAPADKLATYRQKRRFTITPEPAGTVQPASLQQGLRFGVQKHAASHLHYDFRLEMDGVLRSWAIPRGPTLEPRQRRLAMQVEDHPIEYLEFEGTIPKGEYGGGTVMLWDLGTYEQRPDSKEGDFKLILNGQKLRGEFALVRMKDKQKEWLLIKKADAAAGQPVDDDHSVKTGRTMEQIAASDDAVWLGDLPAASAELDRAAAVEAPMPSSLQPMLATAIDKPFSDADWLFEPKWDGIRCVAFLDGSALRLVSRRGRNVTFQYPELETIRTGIDAKQAVIDGEIVAYDEHGLPSFHVLQQRMNLENRYDIQRMQQLIPVVYQVFDLVYLDGRDLRALPLVQRKALLQRVIKPHSFIFYCGHVEEHGQAFFQAAAEQGLEGIVAKLKVSPYLPGKRTRFWLKLKTVETIDCVIGGWTDGTGARKALGSLTLGLYRPDGKLQYVTNCGSGFDQRTLRETLDLLSAIEIADRPFVNRPDPPGRYHWVEPRHVCEVKYSNWTPDGHLRHPVFLHLRPDKAPEDCLLQMTVPVTEAIKEAEEEGNIASPSYNRGE